MNRVNDWVGRCLVEVADSSAALSVTLTYRGSDSDTVSLQYRDVQLMLKRLRIDGYRLKYLVAGEYGSKKGRAHWHIVLFFRGDAPNLPTDRRFEWKYWPHGHVYAQVPDEGGIRYIVKYILKGESAGASTLIRMSKVPPIGYDYFMDLAHRMARERLPLWSPEYSIAGVKHRGKDGVLRHRRFWLMGRTREMFFERYVSEWRDLHGEECPQTDFIVTRYFDKMAQRERELDPFYVERALLAKRREWVPRPADPPSYAVPLSYLLLPRLTAAEPGVILAMSDGSAWLSQGGSKWLLRIGSESGDKLALAIQATPAAPFAEQVVGWLLPSPPLSPLLPG